MKKLLSVLFVFTLLVSTLALASCDGGSSGGGSGRKNEVEELNGKTPEEIYEAAAEALAEAPSYEVVSSQVIEMTATYEGETETMEMVQEVVTRVNGDNTYSKIVSENPYANTSMEAWYVDGVVYANSDGTKVKTNLTKEEYMEQYMNADPSESTLLDIPKSWFEDIKFEEDDGEYSVEFVISEEKYNELLGNLGLDIVAIDGDVEYTVYFDEDGNLTHILTEFDMDVSAMGVGVEAHCVSTSVIKMSDVKVTAPADADSYRLVANP